MDIKCKKCECKFNKGCTCMARKIQIGDLVDCETYEYSEKNARELKQHTAKNMFEIADIEPTVSNKDCKIYCDAQCLFNHNGLCNSNGITVLESEYYKKTPCCATQIDE